MEELLARQEEKFHLTIATLEKQNNNLREMNIRLINELRDLRQSTVHENSPPPPGQQSVTVDSSDGTPKPTIMEQSLSTPTSPGVNTDPLLNSILIDSDDPSPDFSPNRMIGNKDTPRPVAKDMMNNTPRAQRPGNQAISQGTTTPKRTLAAIDNISKQQQKKTKHKRAPEKPGNLTK